MRKARLFMSNMGLTIFVYLLIILLGLATVALMSYVTWNEDITATPRSVPVWAEIILWAGVFINIAICFFLGTKLKQLGSHLINFLSVSGIAVFWLLLIAASFKFSWTKYLFMFAQVPFVNLVILIENVVASFRITTAISAIIPTTVIWLGMLCKDVFYE